jgi:hypothetical protein
MEMFNKDYDIVEAPLNDLEEFKQKVRDLLNDGYRLVGQPFVVDRAIFQAMERQ